MVEDSFERDEEQIKAQLEGIKENVEEQMIVWKGYGFITSSGKKVQSVSLTPKKAEQLFEGLKEFDGSQRDFYFRYVNPYKLCEDLDPRAEIKRMKELEKVKIGKTRLEREKKREEKLKLQEEAELEKEERSEK